MARDDAGVMVPRGVTPIYGLYGDDPLDRVWFFEFLVLDRVSIFTSTDLEQGMVFITFDMTVPINGLPRT